MSENLANDVQTLLSGGINNSVTAITTTGNTGFPAANFRVLVDNELMLVTSVGTGTNWTVTRGIEGTTAIAHLDQAPIVHVLTTAGLAQWLADGFAPIKASLGADVTLNNIANYFDGPSIAQGTAGTWFVSGSVTLSDSTAGNNNFDVKLWDGTTVIASTELVLTQSFRGIVSLSGMITSPAGNLRISVKDTSSTIGKISFNVSGNSKDSTITAIRIA